MAHQNPKGCRWVSPDREEAKSASTEKSTADETNTPQRRSSTASVTSLDDEAMSRAVIWDRDEILKHGGKAAARKKKKKARSSVNSDNSWDLMINEAKQARGQAQEESSRNQSSDKCQAGRRETSKSDDGWEVVELKGREMPPKDAPKDKSKGVISSTLAWFKGQDGNK